MTAQDLRFDRDHIWHPYTSMSQPLPCYPVIAARGVELKLNNGNKLIDGMSSWWAAIHGYNHPDLNNAMNQQLQEMSHVMFGGITHQPAITLCKKLVAMTAQPLECVFLADSGSIAVEVALKMALQYWQAKGEKRQRMLALRHSYHGDTLAAISVCDPQNAMHSLYRGYMTENLFAQVNQCQVNSGQDDKKLFDHWRKDDINEFGTLIKQHASEIAAVILEPIVQGAGGMRFYHPNYLKGVRALCDKYNILFIADEIATGFGRTGQLFACDHAQITPDILCLGKALTGGYMTLAATLTTRHIAETISKGDGGCFMHGPTFMANPLACAVANASLALLEKNRWQNQVKAIEKQLWQALSQLKESPQVADVRVLGAIGVVEMKQQINVAQLQRQFVEKGVWIRPFGKLIYLMPPYIIQPKQLTQLTDAVTAIVNS
ncbi:adenosylmethionine--8-amino-7-oxononanoate transaminase [Candidatus Regiella insecticola]|uniref:adenosylmethionine--8-amino-7-oxononanoate transaminase n=1 Tax=Candidatus Regiella insecticola TaxID=138073 RepID=UPI0005C68BE4|nr:adenosylmethionine--8-amino-7-oxononanoate transaminase [Candidatus Regiella insecticola]